MALIGNGAQAEFQALAFHHLLGIHEIRLFDIDAGGDRQAATQPAPCAGPGAEACARSAADAVRGADIVTTVTADKTHATILTPDMIGAGHARQRRRRRLPGQDRAAPRRAAGRACVRRVRAADAHRGRHPADAAVVSASPSCGACCPAARRAANADDQWTVFDSVGFALEDFSALRWLRDSARRARPRFADRSWCPRSPTRRTCSARSRCTHARTALRSTPSHSAAHATRWRAAANPSKSG